MTRRFLALLAFSGAIKAQTTTTNKTVHQWMEAFDDVVDDARKHAPRSVYIILVVLRCLILANSTESVQENYYQTAFKMIQEQKGLEENRISGPRITKPL